MEKSPLILILLGKSGAGKGTQVNLLKEKLSLDYIGSGELLRERKKKRDFTGKKISEVIDNGGIVLTPVIFKLWMDRFEEFKTKNEFNGFVFDGSPRKIKEAYLLEEALDWFEWIGRTKIFLIDVSDEEAIARITKRKVCPKCGHIVLFSKNDPDVEVCEKCGEGLIKRPEDTVESTKKRLEWFQTEVGPVVEYYEKLNRLIRINGEQSVEGVFNDIMKEIEKDDNN
ncbi:MAG: nucleoside monophosphate kinase [Candidatus Paceibacterota bacterium]|jgi:adenylate kinase